MQEHEMPPGMLAKLVVKQVRRDLAQIERHPRADMYANTQPELLGGKE